MQKSSKRQPSVTQEKQKQHSLCCFTHNTTTNLSVVSVKKGQRVDALREELSELCAHECTMVLCCSSCLRGLCVCHVDDMCICLFRFFIRNLNVDTPCWCVCMDVCSDGSDQPCFGGKRGRAHEQKTLQHLCTHPQQQQHDTTHTLKTTQITF